MENTYFGFGTLPNEELGLKIPLPDDDDEDSYTNEEEYDALNDETFGACDPTYSNDWEEQHEQLAEINESSRNLSDKLESTLADLSLIHDANSSFNNQISSSVWAYTPTPPVPSNKTNNNSYINNSSGTILSSLQEASKSFIQSCKGNLSSTDLNHSNNNEISNNIQSSFITPSKKQQICTVEELEKNLIQSSQKQQPVPTPNSTGEESQIIQQLTKQPAPIRAPQQHQLPPSNLVQQRSLLQLPAPPPLPTGTSGLQPPPPHPFYRMIHPANARQMSQPPPQQNLPPINIPPPPPGVRFLPPPALIRPYRLMPSHMHHAMPPPPPGHPAPNGLHRQPPNFMYQLPPNSSFSCRPPQTRPLPLPYNQNMMYHSHQSAGSMQQPQAPQNNIHQQQLHQYLPQNLSQQQLQLQQQQQQRSAIAIHQSNKQNMKNGGSGDHKDIMKKMNELQYNRDEYAGLMTPRDIQWLLNIQMIQLNTGTPYFDDYYYTIYKLRTLSEKKENEQQNKSDKDGRKKSQQMKSGTVGVGGGGGGGAGRQRKNSEKENTPKCHRAYTPMQFENSLGKLQCMSVTAPRKIIDMDVVQHEKDQDGVQPSKDSRKIKQLLLELEGLYSLLLKAMDIKNPMYLDNKEKMTELKQKQWLRELDQATTTEQKQQVLRNFMLESQPNNENSHDYISKVINGLLKDDKFVGFVNIRKGKMLLIRLLPELYMDINTYKYPLQDIWTKILLSLPIIGRRDTASDNILPSFYPYFKVYILTCSMSDLLDLVSGLLEVVKSDSNRNTPLGHLGKVPLFFVVLNKFGVSVLASLLMRCENLYHKGFLITESQQNEWSLFLKSWSRQTDSVLKVAQPIELIPLDCFEKHCTRFPDLNPYDWDILKKCYVEN